MEQAGGRLDEKTVISIHDVAQLGLIALDLI